LVFEESKNGSSSRSLCRNRFQYPDIDGMFDFRAFTME
jgi:hypothetical protein